MNQTVVALPLQLRVHLIDPVQSASKSQSLKHRTTASNEPDMSVTEKGSDIERLLTEKGSDIERLSTEKRATSKEMSVL